MSYLRGFDILLLSETRASDVSDSLLSEFSIAFSPASRQGVAGEGLLVAVKKSLAYHVQDWSSDTTSLWVKLIFQGDATPLIVGTCYIPPAGSHNLRDEGLQTRMSNLAAHVVAAHEEGHVFLGGDFNARIGHLEASACAGQRGCTDGVVTAHGRHLLSLCHTTSTLLCTGRTPGDEQAPLSLKAKQNSVGSRIDHVIISAGLASLLQFSRVNPTRPESDHHPIENELIFPIVPVVLDSCTGSPLPKCHWDAQLQDLYCRMLLGDACQVKLHAAEVAAGEGNITAAFNSLAEGIELGAQLSGMPRRGTGKLPQARASQPFFDAECIALKRATRRARDPALKRVLERQYHSVVRAKRRAHRLARLRVLLAQEKSQPRRFWKTVRATQSGLPLSLQPVQKWDAFLSNVADCGCAIGGSLPPDAFPQQPLAVCLNDPITTAEIQSGLDKLHNGRAKGILGLPSELLRYAKLHPEARANPQVHVLVPALSKVLNAAFQHGNIPAAINVGLVSPVLKRGDPLDTNNYRPITITDPLLRLYAGILNARVLQYTESHQLRAETQTGFRPGLSTTHQLFALQILIDDAFASNSPLYACFLDFKGAYDNVQRELLWQVLQKLGIHGNMLAAIQSLYQDSTLAVNINGRYGKSVPSKTGLKQGCPLSPTLFGLFADGLHRFLKLRCPQEGPCLADGTKVADLGYADDFVLLAKSPDSLQKLIDAVLDFCALMGLQLSVPKTKVLVFTKAPVAPVQCSCLGVQLELVTEFKYLGIVCTADTGLLGTFPHLSRKMWAAWALLKRQYGRLQCLSSAGLMFRLYTVCVPPAGSYGCEIWSPYHLTGACATARQALTRNHLQMLREIAGVRSTVATPILLCELQSSPLDATWWLRTVQFWNSIAALPSTHLYKRIALHACHTAVTASVKNWAYYIFKGIRRLGYDLAIRIDALDIIDMSKVKQLLAKRQTDVWQHLDFCPRTCPSSKARLCTYACWFAQLSGLKRQSLLNLPLSMRCMHRFLRFRMGCHSLPRDVGSWTNVPRADRLCTLCDSSALGDEKHLIFDCPALQSVRHRYRRLFTGIPTMRLFMWQDDLVGVAKFIDECLEIVYSAGPLNGGQASDQP